MEVVYCPEAEDELAALPVAERVALLHAVEKLVLLGDRLPFPHSSAVKLQGKGRRSGSSLRELRPRGGRSRWRAFYRRVGDLLIIAAIGPEASVDPTGFRRAVGRAEERLAAILKENNDD